MVTIHIIDRRTRRIEVVIVERVHHFKLDLRAHPLLDGNVLREREIGGANSKPDTAFRPSVPGVNAAGYPK